MTLPSDPDLTPSAAPSAPSNDILIPGRVLLLAVVGVVIVAALGWMVYDRMTGLESRIAELDQQVVNAERNAQDANNLATAAQRRSELAEQNARQAAQGRHAAVESQRAAENEADFARQEADAAMETAFEARAEADEIRRRRDAELAKLRETLGMFVDAQRTPTGLVMTLGEDAINFDFDKAVLKPEDRELLARISGVLLTASGYRVQVYGHTDDVGSQRYNLGLSERRASAVADYLVAAGISRDLLATEGFGKAEPLVEGTAYEARARNRRVEIGIIDTVVSFTTTAGEHRQR